MERHFDASELDGIVREIDRLFSQRFDALVESLNSASPPREARLAVWTSFWWP